jgi:solute:Na+ symporter, SSS family
VVGGCAEQGTRPRITSSPAGNLNWWIIGASIFASNIGSEHVVGLAGAGATSGVALAHYELHAWCLLVLGWVFVPFYMRSMVFTMPEFLERRFSPGSRYVLSVVSIITFIVSKIAVGIFAVGVVFGTWSPVIETNAAGHIVKQAWYFNGNFPWLGMLVCAPIIGLWYWCTDQYIV